MRRVSSCVLTVFITGVALHSVVTPAKGVVPGDNGRVVYERHGDLWMSERNGNPIQLTTGDSTHDNYPAWSPDRQWIAFARSDGTGLYKLAFMNVSSRAVMVQGGNASCYQPTWSPNGTQVVFVCHDEARRTQTLRRADFSNGEIRNVSAVTSAPANADYPDWSPTGEWIAFSGYYPQGDGLGVFIVHPDGTSRRKVSTFPDRAFQGPSWSPDGERLVYAAACGNCPYHLWEHAVFASGGTTLHGLTSGPNISDTQPTYSPDGSFIAFTRGGQVQLLDRSGRVTPLSSGPGTAPDWEERVSVRDLSQPHDPSRPFPTFRPVVTPTPAPRANDGLSTSGPLESAEPDSGSQGGGSGSRDARPGDGEAGSLAELGLGRVLPPIEGADSASPGQIDRARVAPGDRVTLRGSGFSSSTALLVEMRSEPNKLGDGRADENGGYRLTVAIPDEVETGTHRIDVTGEGAAGGRHDSYVEVVIEGEATASDGRSFWLIVGVVVLLVAAGGVAFVFKRRAWVPAR